uniref:Uncharacterized protein n=1 Tax=Oryza punctata TaxID=4537 RepID=A0A0E0JP54_ORYPU
MVSSKGRATWWQSSNETNPRGDPNQSGRHRQSPPGSAPRNESISLPPRPSSSSVKAVLLYLLSSWRRGGKGKLRRDGIGLDRDDVVSCLFPLLLAAAAAAACVWGV